MWSTIIQVATFAVVSTATILSLPVFLRWGARWAKIEGVTLKRAVFASLLFFGAELLVTLPFRFISPASDAQLVVVGIVEIVLGVVVTCSVLAQVLKTRFLRALQAWLLT